DGGERPSPYSPRDMGPPPKHRSIEGRLNPPGIPYLYLASDPDTAIAEVRPWIGAELTVGKFRVTRQLRVVDTSLDTPRFYPELQGDDITDLRERENATYSQDEKEQQIWGDINSAFSEPMSPAESHLTYLPTQYLAEVLKVKGFNGVKYRSSLNPRGYNVALFDPV